MVQAPFLCCARCCTVRHGRRKAPEAAVQVDPGLRATAVGLGWISDYGEDKRLGSATPGTKTCWG